MNTDLQRLSVRIRDQRNITIGSGLLYITEQQDYACVLTAAHIFDNVIYPVKVQCFPDEDALSHENFCFSVDERNVILHEKYRSAVTPTEKAQYDTALIRLPRTEWMEDRATVFFDHAHTQLKIEGFGYAANSTCADICLDVISFTPDESKITNMSKASHCMVSILKGDFEMNHANRAQESTGFSGTAIAAANQGDVILVGFAISIQPVNGLLGRTTLVNVYPAEELLNTVGIECKWKTITEDCQQNAGASRNIISSTRFFVHRESELEDIEQKLSQSGTVVLTGMGGIGKTGLARHYASIHGNAYSQLAFIPCSDSVASGIANSIKINGIQRRRIGDHLENDDQLSHRILEALRRQTSNTWLLIFDNVSPRDPLFSHISELTQHKIVTSRWSAREWHCPLVEVSALDDFGKQKDLFEQYLGREISTNEADDFHTITTIVEGHTLTLQLIALQCSESDFSLSEICSALEENGIYTDNPDEFSYDETRVERNMYGHIRAIWNLSAFSDEESRIMQGLSLLTPNGITRREYKEWLQLQSMRSINQLRNQGWIQSYFHNGREMISLHAVISEIILRELYQATPADLSSMVYAIICVVNDRNLDEEDQSRYISYGMSVGSRMVPSEAAIVLLNLTGLHLEYFRRLEDAIRILTYTVYLVQQTNTEQTIWGGHTQNNLAVAYQATNELALAHHHFQNAVAIYRRCGDDAKGNLGYALHNIAGLTLHADNPEEAMRIEDEAEPLIRQHMIVHLGKVYDVRRECHRCLVFKKYSRYEQLSNASGTNPFLLNQLQKSIEDQIEKSLACGQLAVDYKRQYDPDDAYELNRSIGGHALNKAHFRQDPQAATDIQDVLAFFIRTTGEQSEHTGHIYDKMCLIYENLGDAKRSCEYGTKAVAILSHCLGSNHDAVKNARYNLRVARAALL